MSAPPGLAPAPSPDRQPNENSEKFLPARTIAREIAKHWRASGVDFHPADLRRTVRHLTGQGVMSIAELHHRLAYADPTGEDAARHVDSGRRDMRLSWKARS